MTNAWFKFYPSAWRSDPALRMCSVAARGLWMEMLCVMHEAEPRGTLRVNGLPLSARQLASLAGIAKAEPLITELEEAGVFSREEDGTIFSRRMMRDEERAQRDKANGRKGGNPTVKRSVNGGVNPPPNPTVKAKNLEARDKKTEPIGSAKKTGCRLPDDFQPDREFARTQGLSSQQIDAETARFRDFWAAKTGKDATKADWPATWRNWVRNAVERRPVRQQAPPQGAVMLADLTTAMLRNGHGHDERYQHSGPTIETGDAGGDDGKPEPSLLRLADQGRG